MDEDTPRNALSSYGREKAACEDLLLGACRDEGFPVTVLRPPHIMGAGGQLGTGSLQERQTQGPSLQGARNLHGALGGLIP